MRCDSASARRRNPARSAGVSIAPGRIVLTRTPAPANSRAAARVNAARPPFIVAYAPIEQGRRQSVDRGDVDDRALPGGQLTMQRLDAEPWAAQVDPVDVLPFVDAGLHQRPVELDRRVVDECVHPGERPENLFDRHAVGDVELDCTGAIRGQAVGRHDVPSGTLEMVADRATDTSGRSSHDDGAGVVVHGRMKVTCACVTPEKHSNPIPAHSCAKR